MGLIQLDLDHFSLLFGQSFPGLRVKYMKPRLREIAKPQNIQGRKDMGSHNTQPKAQLIDHPYVTVCVHDCYQMAIWAIHNDT